MPSTKNTPRTVYTTTLTPELKKARKQLRVISSLIAVFSIWLCLGLANCSIDPELSTEMRHPFGSLTHHFSALLISSFGLVSFSLCLLFTWISVLVWRYRWPRVQPLDVLNYLVFLSLCATQLEISLPNFKLFGAPVGGAVGQWVGTSLSMFGGILSAQLILMLGFIGVFIFSFKVSKQDVIKEDALSDAVAQSAIHKTRAVKSISQGQFNLNSKIFEAFDDDFSMDLEPSPHLSTNQIPLVPDTNHPQFYDDRDLLPSEPLDEDSLINLRDDSFYFSLNEPKFDLDEHEEIQVSSSPRLTEQYNSVSANPPHITNYQERKRVRHSLSPLNISPSQSTSPTSSPVHSSPPHPVSLDQDVLEEHNELRSHPPLPKVSRIHLLEKELQSFGLRFNLVFKEEAEICDTFEFIISSALPTHPPRFAQDLNRQIKLILGKSEPSFMVRFEEKGLQQILQISWPKRNGIFPSTNRGINEVRRLGAEDPLNLYLGDLSNGTQTYLPFQQVSSLLIAGGAHVELNVGLDLVLTNLIYQASPKELRLLVIDPISETSSLHGLPHLYSPILDTDECIADALNWFGIEFRRRLSQISRIGAHSFSEYVDRSQNQEKRIVLIVPDLQRLNKEQLQSVSTCLDKLERSPHDLGLHMILNVRTCKKEVLPRNMVENIKAKIVLTTERHEESEYLGVLGAEWLLNKHDMLLKVSDGVHRVHGWQFSHASFVRVLNVFAATVPVEYIRPDRVFIQTLNTMKNRQAKKGGEPSQKREGVQGARAVTLGRAKNQSVRPL